MFQKTLPPECLLKVLRILSQGYDTDTMTRLLCVNKSFCAATLPFLYRDCFNTNMHRRSNKSPEASLAQLIRTLIRQVHPQDRIPGLLQAAYLSQGQQDDPQTITESPLFNYGRFIRKFVLHKLFESPLFSVIGGPAMEYAYTHQLYEEYYAEGIFSNNIRRKELALERAVRMDLNRQLVWTLCQDHMGTVEELAISSLDIERYIDHIHHLTSLSRVKFTVTDVLWLSRSLYTITRPEDWNRHSRERAQWRDGLIRSMVHFVERHACIHNNKLRYAEVPILLISKQTSAMDAQFEILSLLAPLQNPRSIDSLNMCALVGRLPDTNLDYVESIDLIFDDPTEQEKRVSKLLSARPLFLSRCRGLKRLVMETLGPDMFQWAVLEKKQKDMRHHQESGVGRYLSSQEHGYHHDLVPLQSIKLVNEAASVLVQEVNDIAFAFSDTLEELAVSDRGTQGRPIRIDLGDTPQVVHGRGWNLPCLRALSLKVHHFQLCFDLDALHRSSALESLCLKDSVATYSHQDIVLWSSFHLPHLKKLKLTGSPALRFNLESLHHSPCLEELTMGILLLEREDGHFYFHIPSSEDLEGGDSGDELSGTPGTVSQGYPWSGKRPQWTWDWYLPMLCKLDLEAIFACKFNFQWLQHLPNLQHICLDTVTADDTQHRRHVTLKHLLRGRLQRQDEDEVHITPDRYVSLLKLESIELSGHWIFDEKVLETLFLIVAPNLRRVKLGKECSGYTAQEMVTLARMMPLMERLALDLLLNRGEAQELGLTSEHELEDDQCNIRCREYNLGWQTFYDILGNVERDEGELGQSQILLDAQLISFLT
ncbi:MAG: hypothetical protein J3Q66DRAFT_358526, partial [Benniella sp.]